MDLKDILKLIEIRLKEMGSVKAIETIPRVRQVTHFLKLGLCSWA